MSAVEIGHMAAVETRHLSLLLINRYIYIYVYIIVLENNVFTYLSKNQKRNQKCTEQHGGAREARAPPRVARYIFDYIFEFRAYVFI